MNSSGQRLLKYSWLVLLLVGGIWLWVYSQKNDTLPINSVKIVGKFQHLSQSQIQRIALPYVNTGFFAFNANELRLGLKKLPWIDEVAINRVWPDTLVIYIKEQQPLARWNNNAILNQRGEVFMPTIDTISPQLPQFVGPDRQAQQIKQTFDLMTSSLKPLGLSIVELHLSARWSWWLRLNNGMVLMLGREDPLVRLQRFTQVYNQVFGSRGSLVERVDLRYTKGMAVKWKHENTVAESS